MTQNKHFFNKVFGDEITNVEFFGTKEKGFNCLIYSKEGKQFFSNSKHKFYNVYDAFAFAYHERYKKDLSLSDINV